MIYLDYAATAPLREEALAAMLPLLKDNYGNPDSTHAAGRRAAFAVSNARDKIAELIGVLPQEVYFTSGGTEADNWAVQKLGTGSVALSAIEHAAAMEASKLRAGGKEVIACNQNGIVTADSVARALNDNTGLVCVMAANNETGCIQPIEEISALCHKRGVPLFSDCVQAASACNLKALIACVDAAALSAHKLGGPKGTGVLVVKKGVKLSPLIAGGEQERSLRGGTLNAAGIAGFAAALECAVREREAYCAHTAKLRDAFEREVTLKLSGEVMIDGENRLPNISHLTFASGEAMLAKLDLKGLCVSGGAACSSHSALPSHVMLAMGRTEEQAKRGVRFSFGRETTEEEAIKAAALVAMCYRG